MPTEFVLAVLISILGAPVLGLASLLFRQPREIAGLTQSLGQIERARQVQSKTSPSKSFKIVQKASVRSLRIVDPRV